MIVDYHIHTKFSPDAVGNITDCIREAENKSIDEIGFSEHVILHYERGYPYRSPDAMENYVEEFFEVKSNSMIPIKLGAEIDFFPKDAEKIEDFIQKYPFDYVIGSVHYLGSWSFDSPLQIGEYFKRDISEVYEDYFNTVRELCQSKLFDILGHADIIKIFGFKSNRNLNAILKETAETIARSDMCVEINTSGLIKPCAEIYPSKQFLTLLKKNQVPITLGSDAHKPCDVGRRFDEAKKLIQEVGYEQVCIFEMRRRRTERIKY